MHQARSEAERRRRYWAGVSARTLHYCDEIGLLKPASYGENGYRYYGEEAVLRLRQILFFRELDFSPDEIREIIDQPEFDVMRAVQLRYASRVTDPQSETGEATAECGVLRSFQFERVKPQLKRNKTPLAFG